MSVNWRIAVVLVLLQLCAWGDEAPPKVNRLAKETSPYLLQHAKNPVDWYPWGEEALARAKKENKPIFLSIGYSSCHWCHVMERESFMDDEIARFLNENFVCIKVDREERPDLDAIYMTAVQIYNQLIGSGRGGGWPMSVFLTPDSEPFFAGTYFPPRDGDRSRGTGFLSLIKKIRDVWKDDADRVRQDGQTLTRYVKLDLDRRKNDALAPLAPKIVEESLETLGERFDRIYGGFGFDPMNTRRPKFPEPSHLFFLLNRGRDGNDDAKKMLELTLDQMRRGGIWDHLGGGFHRYSTDRLWRIPHFEKMLYDNGQLASVYAESFSLTKRSDYRVVVEELLAFVDREMKSPEGVFYSAIDADSEHEEGKFYRWSRDEIKRIVSADEYDLFAATFGLDGEPNFEEKFYVPILAPLGDSKKKDALNAVSSPKMTAIRQRLLAHRDKRERPLTDTKVLTSWNGLMIRGYADAGRILEKKEYVNTAEQAAEFLYTRVRDNDGKLFRTFSQGHAKLNAYLDDYAFLVDGLIALHRATNDQKWLDRAATLTHKQIELFWDDDQGGFFFTSDDHEQLIARVKDPVDGAEPSGNSVSAGNLVYLAKQTENPDFREKAEKTIMASAAVLQQSPTAASRMVATYAEWLSK